MAVIKKFKAVKISQNHLLGIQNLSFSEVSYILDEAKAFIKLNKSTSKKTDILRGKTQINLFFEPSTRTQSSFELAGKRLGADVMSMNIVNSAIKKGETLIDTAMTLNAMHADILIVRHPDSGAVKLLSEKVNCAIINAGDGTHEHPTQALLDALTIKRNKKNYEISGKFFDATILLDKMIKSDGKNAFSNILNDFNTDIKFNIDQTYIDDYLYLNGINGNLKFSKNNLFL